MNARELREASQPRLGLRRMEAAAAVAVSPTKFDEWVTEGLMPCPKRHGGVVVWDLDELRLYFKALPSDCPTPVTDEWGNS